MLLVGDDQGYPDFGFMGNEIIETPNLDRLASEGTVFNQAHSTSNVCRRGGASPGCCGSSGHD